ncbi:MAG: hypothetical protein PUB28_09895 [Roseburia sp.]|uniref:hypothetical protein n=1 Tax=Roseburia sp. 831b TaxID=1261635 RepID=UPI0009519BA1|nr:hypothetical protein [Roseburia sp. 831b]MDD6217035.1 hypothetical protein [Roseburia sp.]MDY5882726.1 hypothetical protein [Roseburia sp.]WVK73386.1 hypothetical protein BIV16_02380 [Roseburia sp. 831b]
MIELIAGFAVAIVLLGVEYFLCTKLENPLWGGIIPFVVLIASIALIVWKDVPLTSGKLVPFILLNVICFLEWASGREKHKQLKQAELERMKAKDIQ